MPEYSTGKSQPQKSTILAPAARWTAFSAVRFSATPDGAIKLISPLKTCYPCKAAKLAQTLRRGQDKRGPAMGVVASGRAAEG
jgi:hypothetical protein